VHGHIRQSDLIANLREAMTNVYVSQASFRKLAALAVTLSAQPHQQIKCHIIERYHAQFLFFALALATNSRSLPLAVLIIFG
jgi:hypothetical protein